VHFVRSWLRDASLADSIAGDLEEERRRRAVASTVRAAIWYWRTALVIAFQITVAGMATALGEPGRSPLGGRGFGEWRQGFRSLRRTPWYSATVTSVIALAMTLASTVFAIVDGVLFKPLPYPRSEELFLVGPVTSGYVSTQEFEDWVKAVPDVPMALYRYLSDVGATKSDPPRTVTGGQIGPGFFEVLGVRPLLGGFQPSDFTPTAAGTGALISYRLWQVEWGGRGDVVGQRFDLTAAQINGRRLPSIRIAGVLPKGFVFPNSQGNPDVIFPFAPSAAEVRERNYGGVALLRVPPATLPMTEQRLSAIAAAEGFSVEDPQAREGRRVGVSVRALDSLLGLYYHRDFRDSFVLASLLVLLAVVNVATLGIARTRQRIREMALHQALGATRWHLLHRAVAEVAPVVIAGVGIGVALSPITIAAIAGLLPSNIVLLKAPSVDGRVIGFASLTAVLLTILIVLLALRRSPATGLGRAIGSANAAAGHGSRWSSLLMTAQIAITVVLALGGALVVGSLWRVWQSDPGFTSDRAAYLELDFGTGAEDMRQARYEEAIARMRATPGVTHVGLVGWKLLQRSWLSPGIERPSGARPGREELLPIGGDFFTAVGLRLVRGRLPTSAELESEEPFAVVSERVSRDYWPDAEPIGQVLRSRKSSYTVIGVVNDARFALLDNDTRGQIYLARHAVGLWNGVVVKGAGSADSTLRSVLATVQSMGAPVGVVRAMTMNDALADTIRVRSFRGWFFGGFAASAIVIAGVGILGLVAMSTALRTREIGIRSSLGATRNDIVKLLLLEQSVVVAIGLVMGAGLCFWLSSFVRSYLYGLTAFDPIVWVVTIGVILIATTTGALLPARRAARMGLTQALRVD
jgi:predicted permease